MSRPHSKTVPWSSPNVPVKSARGEGTQASRFLHRDRCSGVHAALPHCVVVRGGPTQFNVLSLISHLQDLSVRTGLNRSVSNTIRF